MRRLLVLFTFLFLAFVQQGFSQTKVTTYEEPKSSVLATGNWFKLGIEKTGIYKLTYADLQTLGVNVSGLKSSQISIFGNGGGMLPENNTVPRYNDLAENAIYISDDGQGNFNTSSYILFYAESPNVWAFDAAAKRFNYNIHLYSKQNYYFLGIGENLGTQKRIQIISSSANPTQEITEYNEYTIHKNELINPIESGRDWFGEEFRQSLKAYSFPFNLQDVVVGSNLDIYMSVGGRSGKASDFIAGINGKAFDTLKLDPLKDRPAEKASKASNRRNVAAEKASVSIEMVYNAPDGTSKGWLERIEINFVRNLKLAGEQMNFRSIASVGDGNVSRFVVSNGNSRTKVWDVTNSLTPVEITGQLDNTVFSFSTPTPTLKEFVVFTGNSSLVPQLLGKVENQNLHSLAQKDYLIVTHPDFLEQALKLDSLHSTYNNLEVAVVTTDQIYNEFSSGVQDPMAIRAFAKMFYDRSKAGAGKAPQYLLAFGCGTFDHKKIVTNNKRQFLVIYQSDASTIDIESNRATDDVFGFLENVSGTNTLNIGIGRLPVTTVDEAKVAVAKSASYLLLKDITDEKSNGDWRNTIALIADDPDDAYSSTFFNNCENLATNLKVNYPYINVEKIYADAYKVTSSAVGSYYPEVVKGINNRMNKGCLMMDYVGHGSDSYLGHERYITQTDIAGWTNANKLSVLVTNTCQFARFDKTFEGSGKSAGENAILHAEGGCIALISCTRKVTNDSGLNAAFFTNALSPENGKIAAFGDVMRKTKNAFRGNTEYILLGDPALNLPLAENKVNTLKINAKNAQTETDTIIALSEVVVEGEVTDKRNNKLENFNGNLYVTVYDKPTEVSTLGNKGAGSIRTFEQQKSLVYKGITKVEQGDFTFTFIVPKDISYKYGYGKISYYAQNDSVQASDYYNEFVIGDIDQTAELDTTAPNIKLYLNDTNFYSGGVTDANPILFAVLTDKHGINMTGAGIGHDIIALVDGNVSNPIILNDFYVVDEKDPKKGYLAYPLSQLSQGKHTLELTAWNIYNISAKAAITFQVKGGNDLALGDFHIYPNPFSDYANFALEQNQPENIKSAQLLIYNMQGQIIRKIEMPIDKGSFVIGPVQWDGTSSGGARLAAGIFVARMIVETYDGEQQTITKKIVMAPY